jgi:hypothetical protein
MFARYNPEVVNVVDIVRFAAFPTPSVTVAEPDVASALDEE